MLKLLTITHNVFLQYAYSHVSHFHKWRITYPYPYPYRVSCDLDNKPLNSNNKPLNGNKNPLDNNNKPFNTPPPPPPGLSLSHLTAMMSASAVRS